MLKSVESVMECWVVGCEVTVCKYISHNFDARIAIQQWSASAVAIVCELRVGSCNDLII